MGASLPVGRGWGRGARARQGEASRKRPGEGSGIRQSGRDILTFMQRDKETTSQWSRAAPYWEKHRETIRAMFAPVTDALIEDAQIAHGHSILDVATGAGEPALSIAAVVGPNGRVIGVDPAPEMIAAAA